MSASRRRSASVDRDDAAERSARRRSISIACAEANERSARRSSISAACAEANESSRQSSASTGTACYDSTVSEDSASREDSVCEVPALLLLRHGPAAWNDERRYLGWTDQPVTPHGYATLDPAKAWLQGRPLSGAVSSDLLRARQSLRYAAPDMAADASCDPRLRELSFGDWEGLTYEELKDSDIYRRWLDDPASVAPPGGESLAQLRSRIWGWLSEQSLADNGPPLLVATHGGTIRMIAALLRPGSDFWSLDAPPGSLHAVYGTGGGDIRRVL